MRQNKNEAAKNKMLEKIRYINYAKERLSEIDSASYKSKSSENDLKLLDYFFNFLLKNSFFEAEKFLSYYDGPNANKEFRSFILTRYMEFLPIYLEQASLKKTIIRITICPKESLRLIVRVFLEKLEKEKDFEVLFDLFILIRYILDWFGGNDMKERYQNIAFLFEELLEATRSKLKKISEECAVKYMQTGNLSAWIEIEDLCSVWFIPMDVYEHRNIIDLIAIGEAHIPDI